jgi:hypothetical protein
MMDNDTTLETLTPDSNDDVSGGYDAPESTEPPQPTSTQGNEGQAPPAEAEKPIDHDKLLNDLALNDPNVRQFLRQQQQPVWHQQAPPQQGWQPPQQQQPPITPQAPDEDFDPFNRDHTAALIQNVVGQMLTQQLSPLQQYVAGLEQETQTQAQQQAMQETQKTIFGTLGKLMPDVAKAMEAGTAPEDKLLRQYYAQEMDRVAMAHYPPELHHHPSVMKAVAESVAKSMTFQTVVNKLKGATGKGLLHTERPGTHAAPNASQSFAKALSTGNEDSILQALARVKAT